MPGPAIVIVVGLLAMAFPPEPRDLLIAQTPAGPLAPAPLVRILANLDVALGGKAPKVITAGDLLSLRREGVPLPPGPPPPFLVFTTGERIPLAKPLQLQLEDEQLSFTYGSPLKTVFNKTTGSQPQAAIALICLAWPQGVDDIERLNALLPEKRSCDLLLLRNGDRLEGTLAPFDRKTGVKILVDGKAVSVPVENLCVIAFNPELQAKPRSKKMFAQVVLRGGTRLHVHSLAYADNADVIDGITVFGNRLNFPAKDFLSLRIRQGKAVYLDELKPKAYETIPFLDLTWPFGVNRSLLGSSLRQAGDVVDAGIATHSQSRLTYTVPPGSRWFEANVSVDAAAGPKATVHVAVEADGQVVPAASQLLKASTSPVPLRVDLRGAKTVSLRTDFGPLGDVQGHAVWGEARFVRE